jgi:gliding motility-associated-like protein
MICSLGIKSQTWLNVTTDYVNNPSFEEYSSCPQNTSDPSNYWIDSCKNWSHVTYASPDYLNSCANGLFLPNAGVPNNIVMIRQYPFDGNAYLGFFAHAILGWGSLWCEYVQTKLNKKLINGKNYKYTMRISPSKNNAYGISKIGVNMSENSLSNNFQQTSFKFNPTMLNSKGLINDTTKWFLFEEEFVANGNENFITIGWFADTLTSDNGYFDSLSSQIIYADTYYAIDSINLLELSCTNNLPNIFTPNGDNVNDVFKLTNCGAILNTSIYNRWGNLVFQTENQNHFWDGRTTSGEECVDGIYYYIIETKEKTLKDFIQLIR